MDTRNPEAFTIQKLEARHLEQYNQLLRYAFQVTDKDLNDFGWGEDEIRQSKFPVLERANVLGCFDGDRLASQFAVYPLRMNVHGATMDIGFITSVSTYPEYMGLGMMSRLMKRSLTDMRDQGKSLSLLYPYSIPLYRRKGWEIISDKMAFNLRDNQLPKSLHAPGYIRRVPEDSPDLMRLHARFAAQTHGCIFRNDLAWEEYWRWDVEDTEIAIYYQADDTPLGYMVYLLKDETMHIKEMVYLNMEAWKGLWQYICAHESMVESVVGNNYSNEPIAFWLEDSDIKETIRPYIMGRVVDVERFVSQYRFCATDKPETLTFVIEDSLLPWNDRAFTLAFDSGRPAQLIDQESPNRVRLSVGTFTALMLSYKRASYLYGLERLEASPSTLALLERLIPSEKAHISDYI